MADCRSPGLTLVALVTARDEADRLGSTLAALATAFPEARLVVADDGSRDATIAVAEAGGATVMGDGRRRGKGGAATLAAGALLARPDGLGDAVLLLCDADLGASAGRLAPLPEAVRAGRADLAIAAFAQRRGGGVGLAVGAGRWLIARRCGRRLRAPLSGQRAVRGAALHALLPFAAGFGMEVGMTLDALASGLDVLELELELEHRATGRTPRGFAHRAHQLVDIIRAGIDRR